MGLERNKLSCVSVRTLPSISISRATFGSVASDDSACGSPKWIEKRLSCVCIKRKGTGLNPSPLQEERLQRLKQRMHVHFDSSRPDHQQALRTLWATTFPNLELDSLISDQWKKMGWQGKDPSTDFRGAGFISVENLLFFAKTFPASFQRLLNKEGGKRAVWEYPFAVAGMLAEDDWAFDLLYCVAFVVMDKVWLERNATYMEFNQVLRATRVQLEKELLLDDVNRIEDMPSFSLLS